MLNNFQIRPIDFEKKIFMSPVSKIRRPYCFCPNVCVCVCVCVCGTLTNSEHPDEMQYNAASRFAKICVVL